MVSNERNRLRFSLFVGMTSESRIDFESMAPLPVVVIDDIELVWTTLIAPAILYLTDQSQTKMDMGTSKRIYIFQ